MDELSVVLTQSLFLGEPHFRQGGVSPFQKMLVKCVTHDAITNSQKSSAESAAGKTTASLMFQTLLSQLFPLWSRGGGSRVSLHPFPKVAPLPLGHKEIQQGEFCDMTATQYPTSNSPSQPGAFSYLKNLAQSVMWAEKGEKY